MTGPKNLLLSLVGVLGIASVGLAAPALPQPGERAPAGWTGVTGKWEELCKNHGDKPPPDSDYVLTVDIFCWGMKQKHNDKRDEPFDDLLLGRDLSSSFCESIAKSNIYFPGCDKSKGDGSTDGHSTMHHKRDDEDPGGWIAHWKKVCGPGRPDTPEFNTFCAKPELQRNKRDEADRVTRDPKDSIFVDEPLLAAYKGICDPSEKEDYKPFKGKGKASIIKLCDQIHKCEDFRKEKKERDIKDKCSVGQVFRW